MAVGLLGGLVLLLTGFRASRSAMQQTGAANLAADLGDRIRANQAAGAAYALDAGTVARSTREALRVARRMRFSDVARSRSLRVATGRDGDVARSQDQRRGLRADGPPENVYLIRIEWTPANQVALHDSRHRSNMSVAMSDFHRGRDAGQAGFGLVELMVVLVIGAFLMSGSIATYLKAREVRTALDANARMQEIARYAMMAIETDVRMAGSGASRIEASRSRRTHRSLSRRSAAVPRGSPRPSSTSTARTTPTWPHRIAPPAMAVRWQGPTCSSCAERAPTASRHRRRLLTADHDRVLIVTSDWRQDLRAPTIGNQIPAGYATSDITDQAPQADTRALLVNAYYVSKDSRCGPGLPGAAAQDALRRTGHHGRGSDCRRRGPAIPARPRYERRPRRGRFREPRRVSTRRQARVGAHLSSRTGRGTRSDPGYPGDRGLRGPTIEHCH